MNSKTYKIFIKLIIFSAFSFIQGCGDQNVDMVREGVLYNYPDAQIGSVFEANFKDVTWKSIEKNGKQYVVFEGKVNKALHEKMVSLLLENYSETWWVIHKFEPGAFEKICKNFEDKLEREWAKEKYCELRNKLEKTVKTRDKIGETKRKIEYKIADKKRDIDHSKNRVKIYGKRLADAKKEVEKYKNTKKQKKYLEELKKTEKQLLEAENNLREQQSKETSLQELLENFNKETARDEPKLDKEIAGLQKQLDLAFDRGQKLREKNSKELEKAKEEFIRKAIDKYYWPENEPVQIDFVLYPQGGMEIKNIKSHSFDKLALGITCLLDKIYK